jgi:hypothetical protein
VRSAPRGAKIERRGRRSASASQYLLARPPQRRLELAARAQPDACWPRRCAARASPTRWSTSTPTACTPPAPAADLVEAGDILYLVGGGGELAEARRLLDSGPQGRSDAAAR